MRCHIHPVTIFTNLWRVLYIIILPVLRGFFLALQGGFAAWVEGAWFDILILFLMVAYSVARWYAVTVRYTYGGIRLQSGLLFRRQLTVEWERVTTISILESYYLRPFRAVRLRVDTPGGGHRRSDLDFLIRPSVARDIVDCYQQNRGDPAKVSRQYVSGSKSILLFALLSSNSLGGVLFIATFISQSGRLLGNEFSDMIIGTFEQVARVLAFGIPPAAAAIAYVMLAGWFIGFTLTFLRYKGFTVSRQNGDLVITGGIFTNRKYNLRYNKIIFLDIRQSITTKLLRFSSLYISAVGYDKQKDDISCIIPAEGYGRFQQKKELLFESYPESPRQVKPHWKGIVRFIGEPIWFCLGIPAAMGISYYVVPSWSTFILFVGLMSMVPALAFLIIRCVDFATGGISFRDDCYTMRYSKGLILHTVIIPSSMVVKIQLRQSLFQRMGVNCDLLVFTKSESSRRHLCRNLNRHELTGLFHL